MNFSKGAKPEPIGFQLAPMIDVVFLLLCFFMTTQLFAQWELDMDVTLPTSESGNIPDRLPSEIIINIRADGEVRVSERRLDDEALSRLLLQIVSIWKVNGQSTSQPVIIRADKSTDWEHVARVMDRCRQADIYNYSFAVNAHDDDES